MSVRDWSEVSGVYAQQELYCGDVRKVTVNHHDRRDDGGGEKLKAELNVHLFDGRKQKSLDSRDVVGC